MGQPEINSGIASVTGPWIMREIIGLGHTIDLTLTGRMMEADECLRIGVLNRIVDQSEVMNAAIKLPNNFSIQFSGDYRSRSILPQGNSGGSSWSGGSGRSGGRSGGGGGGWGGFVQTTAQGYVNPNYGVDIAIRKDFLKEKRGSVTISMNDLFRSRVYSTYSESTYFVQEFSRRRDWQVLRLNFSYRFGKFDVSLFKRKNNGSGMDGMQEGMSMQQ